MASLNYRDPGTGEFLEVAVGGEVPVGLVVAFAGTTAPAGWHLCDGTAHGSPELEAIIGSANTPNLADRFVVGVGTTHASKATGGAATVQLTGAQSGTSAHTHTVTSGNQSVPHAHANSTTTSLGGHSHAGGYRALSIRQTDMSQDTGVNNVLSHSSVTASWWPDKSHSHSNATSVSGGTHTHRVDVTVSSTAADAAEAHENMPPFYALAFMICTG